MKRLFIIIALLAGSLYSAAAQDGDRDVGQYFEKLRIRKDLGLTDVGQFFENSRIRKDLALTDAEVKSLRDLWDSSQNAIKLSDADRDVKASELKRLLVEKKVDMNAVQKTLREAMDIEYKARLVQIERTVKAREILGEERWARLQKYLRDLYGRQLRMRNIWQWRRGDEKLRPLVPRR